MFNFPQNLYTDVRIEDVYETQLFIRDDHLSQNKKRTYQGAFIRIFDGSKWYYSATTEIANLQNEIDKLAQLATPNPSISKYPVVNAFETNTGTHITYVNPISTISSSEKLVLLKEYALSFKNYTQIPTWTALYTDIRKVKKIYSSKGTNLEFDTQLCGIRLSYSLTINGKSFNNTFVKGSDQFTSLYHLQNEISSFIDKDIAFVTHAKPVEPGRYTVVFSPTAAGVFTHESFGHKSESDLMLGSETMKEEWVLGKKVGADHLTIIDRGDIVGSGYTPFDDEGNKAHINYIIKDGILTGRLHSASTSIELGENVTGNARAMNFEFEPIVRMTTTYIDKGTLTKDELISGIEDGIYIEDIKHGSGMSTFTIAPSTAYRIRAGKIAEPLTISVVSGNVMEALYNIDGISDTVELLSFVGGGCGKMEQFPLPVGFGGPYIRVKNINVQ